MKLVPRTIVPRMIVPRMIVQRVERPARLVLAAGTWLTIVLTGALIVDARASQNAIAPAAPAAPAAPVAPAAPPLARECAFCHGPAGISRNPIWPSLAGLHAAYTKRQLDTFAAGAAGDRRNTHAPQMYAISAELTADERAQLAGYYASLAPPDPIQSDGSAGSELYSRGTDVVPACSTCHGVDASGNPALNGPPMARQPARYLRRQLRAYADGSRGDAGTGMQAIAAAMTEAQMLAVASYLEGTP